MNEAAMEKKELLQKKEAINRTGLTSPTRASSMRVIWTILQREFAGYLNSPVAYILIAGTLLVVGFYFFEYDNGVWNEGRASMGRLLTFVPIFLCLFTAPLFTMRSLAEEKRLGTLELLITMPVKDSEVILGKYFAALAMVLVQLVLLVAYPIVMFWMFSLGNFDWNPWWTGMFGLFLMSTASIAVGLMFSSATESQIVAMFSTAATLGALYFVGNLVETLRGTLGQILSYFSFLTQYEPFSRGVIDTRGVVYFLSISVLCTLVAFRNLESRKWS